MNLNNTNLNLQNIFTNFKDVVKVKDLQKMLGIGRNLLKAPTSTLFELMSFFMEQKKKKESAYKYLHTSFGRGLQGFTTEPITFNDYYTHTNNKVNIL